MVATIVSLGAHAILAIVGAIGVARGLSSTPPEPPPPPQDFPMPAEGETIIVELPQAQEDLSVAPVLEAPTPPPPGTPQLAGGDKVEHVDTMNKGKGGDGQASIKARNLAPRADDDTVGDQLRDDVLDEQENRLKTANERQSMIDRREALQPMELTFVASGKGFRYERHPVAPHDASLGVPSSKPASVLGGAPGQGDPTAAKIDGLTDKLAALDPGSPNAGTDKPQPNQGASYGTTSIGTIQISGADVTKARPHVDQGKPSVMANQKGSAKDTKDSDEAEYLAMKSLVETSSFGGKPGEGKGGSGGGGDPGSGGTTGAGTTGNALGDGNGALDAKRDKRRLTYFMDLQKRLGPLVNGLFPKEEEMALRSGTVIVDLTIGKNGNVVDVVVIRNSGFGAFDKGVVDAIRAAGLLEPVPDMLGMGAITVRVPVQGGWRLH